MADPLEDRLRHPRVDQVSRKTRRRCEEEEEPPHQARGLRPRLGELAAQANVAVNEHLDAEGVQDRHRGRFHGRGEPAEDPQKDDHSYNFV